MIKRYEVQMYDKMHGTWETFGDGYTDRKEWAVSRTRKARKLYPHCRIRCQEITERTLRIKDGTHLK